MSAFESLKATLEGEDTIYTNYENEDMDLIDISVEEDIEAASYLPQDVLVEQSMESELEELDRFIAVCDASIEDESIDVDSVMAYIGDTEAICGLFGFSQESFEQIDEEHIDHMDDVRDDIEIRHLETHMNTILSMESDDNEEDEDTNLYMLDELLIDDEDDYEEIEDDDVDMLMNDISDDDLDEAFEAVDPKDAKFDDARNAARATLKDKDAGFFKKLLARGKILYNNIVIRIRKMFRFVKTKFAIPTWNWIVATAKDAKKWFGESWRYGKSYFKGGDEGKAIRQGIRSDRATRRIRRQQARVEARHKRGQERVARRYQKGKDRVTLRALRSGERLAGKGPKFFSLATLKKVLVGVLAAGVAVAGIAIIRRDRIAMMNKKVDKMRSLSAGSWTETSKTVKGPSMSDYKSSAANAKKCCMDVASLSGKINKMSQSDLASALNSSMSKCGMSVGGTGKITKNRGPSMESGTLTNKGYNGKSLGTVVSTASDLVSSVSSCGDKMASGISSSINGNDANANTGKNAKTLKKAYSALTSYANSAVVSPGYKIAKAISSAG